MGKRVIEILFDDVTGEETDEVGEHEIAIDGKKRYIDMSPETFERFMKAIGPFFEKGRRNAMPGTKPTKTTRTVKRPAPKHDPAERAQLRAWCRLHGVKVTRGRAPEAVWDAFHADDPDLVPADKRTVKVPAA